VARKKRKKKKGKTGVDPYEVIEGNTQVTALEIIRLIHKVNPTTKVIDVDKASEQYRLKARLQSLLIRRFKESLQVEIPDPENSQLVGLRLLHFKENACHTLIHELDDDAGSWVKKQIDEAIAATDGVSENFPKTRSVRAPLSEDPASPNADMDEPEDLPVEEWIKLGKMAMAAYDFEASERYYLNALKKSRGHIEPALCVLELFVEHLGAYEKALDVSKLFSSATGKDQRVKVLLGLSFAHCGQFDQALKSIDRISDPRTVDITLLSIEHFIKKGDENRAARGLSSLKSHERGYMERKSDIARLEHELRALRAGKLKHVEEEMSQAWKERRYEVALEGAEKIVALLPENKAARKVMHDFKKQQRQDAISRLILDADDARGKHAFAREVEILKNVIALGPNTVKLSPRLKYAQDMAEKQQEEMKMAAALRLWKEGRVSESLFQFLDFSKKQRGHILQSIPDPHFRWLEEALSSGTVKNPKKTVNAILALGRLTEWLEKGENIDQIIQELSFHGKTLHSISHARTVLKQAESMLEATESRKNRDLLSKAKRFLTEGNRDLEKAGHCLSNIRMNRLNNSDRSTLDGLKSKLQRLETIQILRHTYESSAAKKDHFSCMDIAGKLSKQEEEGQLGRWSEKIREHAERLKKEWALTSCNIREMSASYGYLGIRWMENHPSCWVLPDNRHLVLTTSHDRWVFIRTFCLEDRTFREGIILRTPEKLTFPNVIPAGNTLWIAGQDGHLLGLCLDPLEIRSWHDFATAVRKDEVIEETRFFPKSRTFWLEKRKQEGADNTIQVIHMDQERTIRKIKSFNYPVVIFSGNNFEIAVADRDDRAVRIYSEEGRFKRSVALERPCILSEAAVHQERDGYIFLTYDNTDPFDPISGMWDDDADMDDDLTLTLEETQDGNKPVHSIRVEDSNGIFHHGMAVSKDSGIIFVFFINDSETDQTCGLAAFKLSEKGFDLLYQTPVPKDLILVSNERSDRIIAISPGNEEMQAIALDDHPPQFEAGHARKKASFHFPEFNSIWVCDVQTGAFNARVLALMPMLKECSYEELSKRIRETKRRDDAEGAVILAHALQRTLLINQGEDFWIWVKKHYPNHCRVLFHRAVETAKKEKWQEVISYLEKVQPGELDDGAACHRCHLLGMAYFAEGDAEKALRLWKEGTDYPDGKCELDPYITYAEISLMKEKKREKFVMNEDMKNGLDLFEIIDRHMKKGDWQGVIATVESANALETRDMQLQARLTHAYLQQDVLLEEAAFICKVLVLANYCERHNEHHFHRNQILPHYMETWSEARLKETAKEASEWLDGLGGRQNLTGINIS